MKPQDFIAKWRNVELKERSASKSHFNDLCALFEIDDPITADNKGDWFTFEKGASKTSGGDGWGDDWRAGLLTEDEILARLFALNQSRAKAEAKVAAKAKAKPKGKAKPKTQKKGA